MRNKIAIIALAAASLTLTTQVHAEEEQGEVKTPFDQVPANVRDTLTQQANGAKIDSVDKETDNGKLVYEADVILNGKNWEIKVGEDGKVVSKKLDTEEDENPEKAEFHGKTHKDEDEHHEGNHDKHHHEDRDGDEHDDHMQRRVPAHITIELSFDDEHGDKHHARYQEMDEEHHDKHHGKDKDEKHGEHHDEDEGTKVAMTDVPAPVQTTLGQHAPGAKFPAQVEKEDKNGMTQYEAHVMLAEKPYEIKIAADGTLLKMKLYDQDHDKHDGKDSDEDHDKKENKD